MCGVCMMRRALWRTSCVVCCVICVMYGDCVQCVVWYVAYDAVWWVFCVVLRVVYDAVCVVNVVLCLLYCAMCVV